MLKREYDRIIIGAGIYGLYSALYCGSKGLSVCVLEKEPEAFTRATYVNQARVHMGYHYPRSLTTAMKSAGYFRRFCEDYDYCINKDFKQIYATSANFSWTNAEQFMSFCGAAGIKCEEVSASKYFKPGMCDGAFLTEEYTYDAKNLRDGMLKDISRYENIVIKYNTSVSDVKRDGDEYIVKDWDGNEYYTKFLLNATYASVNEIISKVAPEECFNIKYELCEIILCDVSENMKDLGLTVMDGPFFSLMPFGQTGDHSLTSVTFTPHEVSYEKQPAFGCRDRAGEFCKAGQMGNCDFCKYRPEPVWEYMSHLAKKYIKDEYGFSYKKSLFSMKPILKTSEVDDSRPTAIRVHTGGPGKNGEPTFISVLSGKINTIYDLDEYLV
ncbi:MAG: FAD-dependent oxidoreductase [Lachnospiraceae bacterium]|nr:FAD-dependent oxidoreductase [Lachnospiraceae bacterium]